MFNWLKEGKPQVHNGHFMQEALSQAKIAFEKNEVPVGCVIVENNQIISSAHNQNLSLSDPTAHAEIVAIRKACELKGKNKLVDCDIFITLEPCPMCLSAISFARIKRVYYGANDEKFGAVESNPIFSLKNLAFFRSEIYSGISSGESSALLQNFFKQKR